MDAPEVKRFVREVFAFEPINCLLRSGARVALPGKPARGGEYTKDQRTWARNFITRKLWKQVPLEHVPLFSGDCACPDLSYLIPHVTSQLKLQLWVRSSWTTAADSCKSSCCQTRAAARARTKFKFCPQAPDIHCIRVERKLFETKGTEDIRRGQGRMFLQGRCIASVRAGLAACGYFFPWIQSRSAIPVCRVPLWSACAGASEIERSMETWTLSHCASSWQSYAWCWIGAEQMAATGYIASVTTAKNAIRRSAQSWRMRNTGGRPSKVKDPKWQALVQEALDLFSTSSSLTCLGPQQGTPTRSQCQRLCQHHFEDRHARYFFRKHYT